MIEEIRITNSNEIIEKSSYKKDEIYTIEGSIDQYYIVSDSKGKKKISKKDCEICIPNGPIDQSLWEWVKYNYTHTSLLLFICIAIFIFHNIMEMVGGRFDLNTITISTGWLVFFYNFILLYTYINNKLEQNERRNKNKASNSSS